MGVYDGRLCMCDWVNGRRRGTADGRICRYLNAGYEEGFSPVIQRAKVQMEEYFAGRRQVFDIPLLFTGSDFQNMVWTELMRIPYGTTVSYAELARRIGKPNAVRAVANANACNPISLFVPCHRVIGSGGTLVGYGGGLEVKRALLTLEKTVSGYDLFGAHEW